MVIMISSTSASQVSTGLGILNPGQTLTQTLLPDAAQTVAYGLTTLVQAGRLTVTLLNDNALLPVFQESGGGGGNLNAQFVIGGTTMRGIVQLYDYGASALKYIYLSNGQVTISDTLPT